MKIIILGAPGAGKGTQGELLAKKFGWPRLSVGALLRRHWRKGSQESREIGKYITEGLNVPAKLLFTVLGPRFIKHKDSFIIDNLPRNLDQLSEFKKFLAKSGLKIDKVFHLIVSEKESVKRLFARQRERRQENIGRPDEEPEVVEVRIKEGYQKDIAPILTFFKEMGILIEINGEQSITKVHKQILKNLRSR